MWIQDSLCLFCGIAGLLRWGLHPAGILADHFGPGFIINLKIDVLFLDNLLG